MRIARLLHGARSGPRRALALTGPELALLHDLATSDWRPVIATCQVPALFVAGAESEFWPSHAAASAAIAPNGASAVIEQCGHVANVEQPKAFNEGLLRFLAKLP